MKAKVFAIPFAAALLCMPVCASGEYASFEDLRAAWYMQAEDDPAQYGWYPDGVCGIWLEQGIQIGITDDARGEAAKAEILGALTDSSSLHFVTQRYTQRELMEIMRTVSAESLGKVEGLCLLALNEPADCVEIGITAEEPAPALRQFMEDCTARWGDAVVFTASGAVDFSGGSLGGTPYSEIGAAPPIAEKPLAAPHHRGLWIAAAGFLLLAGAGVLLRHRQLAAQTVRGGAVLLPQAETLRRLREAAEEPPARLREAVMTAARGGRNEIDQ